MRAMTRPWAIRIAAGSMMTALLLGACSSTSSNSKAAPAGGTSSTATAPASSVSVQVKAGPLGDYLTDGAGRTLYFFANDTSSTSTCYGSCASFWPPLTTTSAATAGSGAQANLLGTSKRSDGTTQVTYAGHPLYLFKLDTTPGDAKGQGKNLSGGLWWIVAPAGTPITGSAAPSPSSSKSSGGGGWA